MTEQEKEQQEKALEYLEGVGLREFHYQDGGMPEHIALHCSRYAAEKDQRIKELNEAMEYLADRALKNKERAESLTELLKITYDAWDNGKPLDNHIVEDIHAFI